MKFKFIIFVPFLLVFCSFSYAQDYYWYGLNVNNSPSASAACSQVAKNREPESTGTGVLVSRGTDDSFGCVVTYNSGYYNGQIDRFTVTRLGDTCPSGTVYQSTDGSCSTPEPPKKDCADTAGTTTISLSSANKQTGGVVPVNNKMCNNSCQFVYTGGNSVSCGPLKASPDTYFCIFNYTGNGQQCDGSEEAANSGAPATTVPPKDPNDPANNCGKGYAWSGSTCVKYWEDEKDSGSTTPKPPTGGGSTGGGGSSGGGAGGGTGTGDAPAPGTDNNGSGAGSGEGKDDDKDIEASSSQDCKKPPACDGDVFSCAILNQSYFDSCRLISLPTEKEKIGRDKEIDIQQDLMQESQDQLDSQVSGFLSKFMSAGSGNYGGREVLPR